MSATQYLKFSGTCKWAKYTTPDDKYGHYSIDMYLDEPSWDLFKSSGLMLQPKEDDDGWYVRFRRPNQKIIKNELVTFGPPDVIGNDGQKIGNGSKVTVEVVVYNTLKGPGHRLNKITVTELLVYVPPQQTPEVPQVPQVAAPVVTMETVEALTAPKKGKRPF